MLDMGIWEKIKLGNGRMVDDPCDSNSNREKGGPQPSLLLNCLEVVCLCWVASLEK